MSLRRSSLSQIVSTLDSSSRDAIELINNAIHLPRRVSSSETMSDPVVCKSVRRTSLGFDDYVSYPTVRHVILDTSEPERTPDETSTNSAIQKSSSHCYCQYPKQTRTQELDSHRKNLQLRPQSQSSSESSLSDAESKEEEIPKIIVTTDLDCPMCLQRVTNSLNRDAKLQNIDENENEQTRTPSPPIRPDRGVHFTEYNPRNLESPVTEYDRGYSPAVSRNHLRQDIDANFKPGQVFTITRPSLFGSSKKSVTFDTEYETDQVIMTSHQRRDSTYPNVMTQRNRSPSAIVSTFLGTSGFGRRFSQDLRLKGPADVDDGKGDTNKVLFYQVMFKNKFR